MNSSNIHIYFSPMIHESRIFKISRSLRKHNIFDHIILAGSKELGLRHTEVLGDGISINRLGIARKPEYKIYNFLVFILYCLSSIKLVMKVKPACLNVHSLTLIPVAIIIKILLNNTILIYDTHELETETNGSSKAFRFFKRIIEKVFINIFAHSFFVSPSILDWYEDKYNLKASSLLMNCPDYVEKVNKTDYFRSYFDIEEGKVIFLYQGILAKGRGIGSILRVLKRMPDNTALVCLGYGGMRQELILEAKTNTKLYIHDAVLPSQINDCTPSADCGISFFENTSLSQYYALPNKLFEFGMCGLPVIVSPTLDQSRYVKENHNGLVCGGFSDDDLYKECMSFIELKAGYFTKNIDLARSKYNWQAQEEIFIEVYKSLLKELKNV